MDFKRALVGGIKGVFCKSIRHLLEGKRACIVFEMFEKSLQICLPVHSSTNLCFSVTLSFIRSNSSTNLCSSVILSFIRSTSFTCPLTCVLLLPCLLLQATRSLVYSHYYIYLPWNRFFSVVPLHRHQE